MVDPRNELEEAELEARRHARLLRNRAERLKRLGFAEIAEELTQHAVGLEETAETIAAHRTVNPPGGT